MIVFELFVTDYLVARKCKHVAQFSIESVDVTHAWQHRSELAYFVGMAILVLVFPLYCKESYTGLCVSGNAKSAMLSACPGKGTVVPGRLN